jgi:hypothetical protein
MLTESQIARALAEDSARRVTRKVTTGLQRMTHTLSGDDSVLETVWDEICVQIQFEDSFAWDAYDQSVRALVGGIAADLSTHERAALWLQTDAGFDWNCEDAEYREPKPFINDDIVDFLVRDHVYIAAGRWSNRRIRAYLDQSARSD